MRYAPWLCWFGLTLTFIACDTGSGSGPSCPAGHEACGSTCVPAGSCMANRGGATGSGGATATIVDPGPFSNPDCTDTATASSTLSGRYDTAVIPAPSNQKTYLLSTNWWSKFDGQTVTYQGLSFTLGNSKGVAATNNDPIGFPTLYIGSYQNRVTAGSNLPKQVSSLTTVPTVLSTNAADLGRDEYNATYDVWFTPTSSPLTSQVAPPAGGAYLMVWLFKPTMRQPRGTIKASGQSIAGIDGTTWDVWVDPSNPLCISYVATSPLNGLSFDLNAFIQDSVTKKFGITSNMYLSIIFAGFEVWAKGDGLQLKNFCAQVN